MKHLPEILFILAMAIIAFGIATASPAPRGQFGYDDIPIPDGWKPFEYNPAIPLRESLQSILWTSCQENDVPFELALAIIETESGFQEDADSGCAHGLMQLHQLYYDPNMPPGENIDAGVKLLADNYARYGNWPAAVTGYAVGHDDGSRNYWMIIEYRMEEWRRKLA